MYSSSAGLQLYNGTPPCTHTHTHTHTHTRRAPLNRATIRANTGTCIETQSGINVLVVTVKNAASLPPFFPPNRGLETLTVATHGWLALTNSAAATQDEMRVGQSVSIVSPHPHIVTLKVEVSALDQVSGWELELSTPWVLLAARLSFLCH